MRRVRVIIVGVEKNYDSVFVAFDIHHATRMRHIFICGLLGSTGSFHIISQTARFKKKTLLNIKCVF
jgi:hypothetical protein